MNHLSSMLVHTANYIRMRELRWRKMMTSLLFFSFISVTLVTQWVSGAITYFWGALMTTLRSFPPALCSLTADLGWFTTDLGWFTTALGWFTADLGFIVIQLMRARILRCVNGQCIGCTAGLRVTCSTPHHACVNQQLTLRVNRVPGVKWCHWLFCCYTCFF